MPLSSLQVVPVTLDVASLAVKFSVTDAAVVLPFAGELMLTVGAPVSTVKVVDAEAEPAALVAVTVIVWLPSANLK